MISKRFKNDSKSILQLNPIQLVAKADVELKLESEKYCYEEIVCPICNSSPRCSQLLSEKDRYGLKYQARICENCGFVYVSPRMTQASYNKFYDLEYRRLYLGSGSPSHSYFEKQYNRGREIYGFISNTVFDGRQFKDLNVLEIGCSSGGILNYFNEKGCQVMGVDLDSNYLQYGREKYGLTLLKGSLKNVPSNYKPDIIIYSHVLEHILNLDEELSNIKKIVSPNTLLYIEVPGIKNIHKAYNHDLLYYFQNAHTFHFSLTSLTNLLNKFGFKLFIGDEFIKSIFIPEDDKTYKIKNDYGAVLEYLRKVEGTRFRNQFKTSTIFLRFKNFGIQKALKIARILGLKKKL